MKTKLTKQLLAAGLGGIAFAFVSTVEATIIADDSFNTYPPATGNSLVGQNGGSGWAGAWTVGLGNTASVVDTTANPLSVTPSGGSAIDGGVAAVELAGTGNQIVVTRQFAATMPSTFYAAYLFRVTAGNWTDTDTCSLHLSANTASTTTPNFGLRGPNLFMVRTGTGAPVAGASNVVANATAVGTTTLLVARFSKLDGGGNPTATYDRLELWVNPTVDDDVNNATGHARLQLAAGTGLATAEYLLVRIAALEAADRVQIDQLVFGTDWADVINPSAAPLITGLAPVSGTTIWPAANGISFAAASALDIETSGISLVLNGVDVSGALTIGGTPTSRTVSYADLTDNQQYSAQIVVSNAAGVSQATLEFDTYSGTAGVIVEAEDYNFDRYGECDHLYGGWIGLEPGAFQDNPPVSGYDLTTGTRVGGLQTDFTRLGYVDALGTPDVDYVNSVTNILQPNINVFRLCDSVGTRVGRDFRRAPQVANNLPEYDVFELVNGEWMNYSRTFAPANYKVYLRVSSLAAQQMQLEKVTSDATLSNQVTVFHGVFRIPNTGNTNTYVYVPMSDSAGTAEVTVPLGGVSTVRLTATGITDQLLLNYLVFVPTGESLVPPAASILTPAPDATFPANANIPISVSATDADGTVTNVVLMAVAFDSTNVLATFTAEPYDTTWNNVPDGRYRLIVRATDNHGLVTVSVPVEITVGNPPLPALFVVGNLTLNVGDNAVRNRLASMGLPVQLVLSTDSTTADAEGKSLILVSSTVLSSDVGTKFTAVAVPVVQWEAALTDEFRLTANGPNVAGQAEVLITAAGEAHPLAAGLPAGVVAVRDELTTFHAGSPNSVAPGAVVVATVTTNNNPLILGVDTGALLNDNSPAPERRVHLFVGDLGVSGLNPAGLALFDAAIHWALGTITPPTPPPLAISRAGTTVSITWPKGAATFILQENPNPANPAGWTDSTLDAEEIGETVVVNITAPVGNLFLRLRSSN